MPYIAQKDRPRIFTVATRLSEEIETEGDLNFAIFTLLDKFVARQGGPRYTNYNKAMGVLDCCAREYYRRRVASYEDQAVERNGDIPTP